MSYVYVYIYTLYLTRADVYVYAVSVRVLNVKYVLREFLRILKVRNVLILNDEQTLNKYELTKDTNTPTCKNNNKKKINK